MIRSVDINAVWDGVKEHPSRVRMDIKVCWKHNVTVEFFFCVLNIKPDRLGVQCPPRAA